MKIGLSLSTCIADIIDEHVSLEDVICIIASTKMESTRDEDKVLKHYCETYWRDNSSLATEIYDILNDDGRIIQPRTFNPPMLAPNITGGHWIEIGNDVHQDVRLV